MWLTAQDGKYSLLCGSLGRVLPHVSYTVNVTNSQSLPVALKIAWSIWQRILALQNMHITLSFSCAKWLKKLFNYYYSILVGRCPNLGDRYLTGKPTLIPRPPISERGLVLTVCAHTKYPIVFCVKSLMHLTCPYAYYTTKNIEFSLNRLQQSINLQNPARILLLRRCSIIFPQLTVEQKGNKWICQKGLLIASETLLSVCTQLVVAPYWILSGFKTETVYKKP